MHNKSLVLLRVLLKKVHKSVPEQLLYALPEEEKNAALALTTDTGAAELILMPPEKRLAAVHYSWLKPIVERFPVTMQAAILSALAEEQSQKLVKLLDITTPKIALSHELKGYLLTQVMQMLFTDTILPLEYLPESALKPLTKWPKTRLTALIDYLGLYDLAEEIRLNVDKNFLKKIYSCIDTKKKNFLRQCLHQKEKLFASRMGLEKWDGDCDKLEALLHRRGLIRLGRALQGEHPDFAWHLIHALDSGRGAILEKEVSSKSAPEIVPMLVQQVIFVMNFLHPKAKD